MVVMLHAERIFNRILARKAKPYIAALATPLAMDAGRKLAAHQKKGKHKIEVTQGEVDTHIALTGSHAGSVEFGHGAYDRTITGKDGKRHVVHVGASNGLHIIGGLRDAGR